MKNLIKVIYACIGIGFLFLVSCSDMNELSNRFLKNGEITYAVLPDSVIIRPGKERLQFQIFIRTNRVKTTRIYWNNRTDSIDVEIGNKDGIFYKTLENLPEQSFLFNLVNIDQYGNKSLPFEVTGNAYGEIYRSSLLNRTIKGAEFNNNNYWTIEWRQIEPTSEIVATQLEYVDNEGNVQKIVIHPDSLTTEIKNMPTDTEYKYRTAYVPPFGIDTFYTDYTLSKSFYPDITNMGGLIEAQYYDSPPGEDYLKIIDNNINTKCLLPHSQGWFMFHQNEPSLLKGYALTTASDSPERDPSRWKLEGSDNGYDWFVLDEKENVEFTERLQTKQFELNNIKPFTFYRLSMNNKSGGMLHLSEWKLFGEGGGGTPIKKTFLTAEFNLEIPATWTNIDKDGDGYTWNYTAENGGFALSSSYIRGVGALNPENYLVTPAIYIPFDAKNVVLRYDMASVSLNYYNEQYKILVSEDPITSDNCRNTTVLQDWLELTADYRNWTLITNTINLQKYTGKTIYIAFLHGNSYDIYGLVLRNVFIIGYNQ